MRNSTRWALLVAWGLVCWAADADQWTRNFDGSLDLHYRGSNAWVPFGDYSFETAAEHVPGNARDCVIKVGPFLQSATPTDIWVVWETDQGEESRVDYGVTPALGNTSTGVSIPSQGSARIHQTQLTGLVPDTTYHYQVITDTCLSDVFRFRTAALAESEASFRFVAYSDSQADSGNPGKLDEVINDGIISFVGAEFGVELADELAFALCAGDLVQDGTVYAQWENDFFDEVQNLHQHVPLYPVYGNHEQDSQWFTDYFQLPANGSPGYLEHWYYVDYGNVRVIGLDSNSGYRIQTQLDWLDDALADACASSEIDFVFAQLHHPHKSELWTPGEIDYTGEVIERLETFSSTCGKPSVHFFGHTHGYSRGQSRDHDHLWVNVATAEGNIDYWGEFANADYPEFEISLPEWGFMLVEVDAGDEPEFRLRRISRGNEVVARDNEVVDEITVRLNDDGPAQPFVISPTMADCRVDPGSVTLQASVYADVEGDEHLESHFQVRSATGDYNDPVVDDWKRRENWYAPEGASGPSDGYYSVNTVTDQDITKADVAVLAGGEVYFWRVRYRDTGLTWSAWSEESEFQTAASGMSVNLLSNPGAEEGTLGWSVVDPPLESLVDQECDSGTSPAGGQRYFAAGGVCADEGVYGEAFQSVDVSADAAAIDAGVVEVYFRGLLKDYSGSDLPEMWLVFRDASSGEVGTSATLGAAIASWTPQEALIDVPPTTRHIEFHIAGTRYAGTDNDCYFDELELRLRTPVQPGDSDSDGVVDLDDFADHGQCLTGPGAGQLPAGCEVFDFDNDCDVDLADFGNFAVLFGGR